jgi:hypothetical protein
VGEACTEGADLCTGGLLCDGATTPPRCVRARSLPAGSVCEADQACGAGLRCDHARAPAVCAPLAGAGEPCERRADCDPRLVCHGAQKRCLEVSLEGGSCALDAEDDDCKIGLACFRGACRPAGAGVLGDPCDRAIDCGGGASCLSTTRLCAPLALGGESCGLDADCAPDLVCQTALVPLACGPRRKPGEACERHAECRADLACVDRRCR